MTTNARTRSLMIAAMLLPVALAAALSSSDGAAIDPAALLRHVQFLASDDLKGRGNGTPELDRAAEYIAAAFREAGLAPGGDRGTYFQPLDIVTGFRVGPGNSLEVRSARAAERLRLGRDYLPISVTAGHSAAPLSGLPLVFAGYGISAPSLGYDDYAGVDAAGKAVLVFDHEPQENDAASIFDGTALTLHATAMTKAAVARARGARVLLIVTDPSHATDEARPATFLDDPQAHDYGITVLRLTRQSVTQALALAAAPIDLTAVAREIDRDVRPRSRAVAGLTIDLIEDYTKVQRTVRNVVGILKGSDPELRSEAVVLGAHYDHIGLGGRLSSPGGAAASGRIHNGADDNASGTAALIEIARVAVAGRSAIRRTLVFAAFAGEEIGLLGSSYYTAHPVVPLDRTVAMIDLDMIGRPGDRVIVTGLDTAPDLEAELNAARGGSRLAVERMREGAWMGSSDDTSFLVHRIPALGFFSGFHEDYHQPTDDWQKIDPAGAAEIARIALALAERLAAREKRIEFVSCARCPRNR